MLLIGSGAAKHWFPNFREPGDYDLICSQEEHDNFINHQAGLKSIRRKRPGKSGLTLADGTLVELETSESGALLVQANEDSPHMKWRGHDVLIARPESLFLIKKSHIDFAIHWPKNIHDFHFLRTRAGEPSELEIKAFKLRHRETAKLHPKPKVNLADPNDKFFNQYNINRAIPHDDVHRAVMFYDAPMFTKLKHDQERAWCSWELFMNLSHEERIRTVQEESFVISLERFVIPRIRDNRPFDARRCFIAAVEALATRMWAGKWKWFIIDNFMEISDHEIDYVAKIEPLLKSYINA